MIALLFLAVLLAATGPASRFLQQTTASRAAVLLAATGVVLAVVGILAGPSSFALAGARARLDALSAFLVVPVLIAAMPGLLPQVRAEAPLAGLLMLVMFADGLLATIILALLCLTLRARTAPVALWALLAAFALALPAQDGVFAAAAVLLAAAGLAALWAGRADPALAFAGLGILARLGLAGTLPAACGFAVLGLGLAGAVVGAGRAAIAESFGVAVPSFGTFATGMSAAALGVAMAARGADLLPTATVALEAMLLGALVQAIAIAALSLAAAGLRAATGTDALARLGGLWPSMPATGLSAVIACAGLASLPPAAGFTSLYLLLQAMFAAHRIGGVGAQLALSVAIAAAGLAAGLGTLASLRLVGFAFLGRNRGGRGADPRGDVRVGMAAMAAMSLVLAIGPQLALLLARPVLAQAGLPSAAPSWLPTEAAFLFAACCAAAWAIMRSAPGARRVPAWEGGAPPGSNLVDYVPGIVASMQWRARPRLPTVREWLALAALALGVVLLVLAAR